MDPFFPLEVFPPYVFKLLMTVRIQKIFGISNMKGHDLRILSGAEGDLPPFFA
jgi:hypothetical protein